MAMWATTWLAWLPRIDRGHVDVEGSKILGDAGPDFLDAGQLAAAERRARRRPGRRPASPRCVQLPQVA